MAELYYFVSLGQGQGHFKVKVIFKILFADFSYLKLGLQEYTGIEISFNPPSTDQTVRDTNMFYSSF